MTSTRLPQVDKILRHDRLSALRTTIRHDVLAQLVREELARLRESSSPDGCDADSVAARIAAKAEQLCEPALKKVVNATGVLLNTNLGRAPLSPTALSDLVKICSGYCNLEIDLASGKRGKRARNVERLLTLLTGAESAIVVNNNAAAVLLCVTALARGKSVIVSRGELIEIGGSFRLPDVIQAGGARLCEVGTTNRTRLDDYKQALDRRAALILRCHRSNFEIRGFTESVELSQLQALASDAAIPFLEDLGSGALHGAALFDTNEPTVKDTVQQGADLISFSGDKLLGGPQAGFIVGKRQWVDRLSKHPLYRALRPDKVMLYLIERCLIAYLSPRPEQHVPLLAMLGTPAEKIHERAKAVAATISDAQKKIVCLVVPTVATTGGGSLPGQTLPSYGIQLEAQATSANKLHQMLRLLPVPVISTIQNDRVVLDFRTISENDEDLLVAGILDASSKLR